MRGALVVSMNEITELVKTETCGTRFRGKVNGKCFEVFRDLGNNSGHGRYSRGLRNEPRNWKCEGYDYEPNGKGGYRRIDPTTLSERKAAKAHCMAIVFPIKAAV